MASDSHETELPQLSNDLLPAKFSPLICCSSIFSRVGQPPEISILLRILFRVVFIRAEQ